MTAAAPASCRQDAQRRGLDVTVPHSARVWSYWLGGKDNYLADRAAADECTARFPRTAETVLALRRFTGRVVRHAAGEGVRQFLDVGCGLPLSGPVHGVACHAAPGTRVVYADNDPIIVAHARAMLTTPTAAYCETGHVDADLRDPAALLEQAAALLDFTQPVAVLLTAVLGHVGHPGRDGDGEALLVTAALRDALAPGSYLAVGDLTTHPGLDDAMAHYNTTGAAPYHVRSPGQVERFLDGLDPVGAGVVPVTLWQPDPGAAVVREVPAVGGAGRKTRASLAARRDA